MELFSSLKCNNTSYFYPRNLYDLLCVRHLLHFVFFQLLSGSSDLDNLDEILDDLQNSQMNQLSYPDTRPDANSVDKQAIINDLMQIAGDNGTALPPGLQRQRVLRMQQTSKSQTFM